MKLFLIFPVIFAESIGVLSGHCQEYSEILTNYQSLMVDHQRCLVENGEKVAQIRTFEHLISTGLQQQIDTIRSTHRLDYETVTLTHKLYSATVESIDNSAKRQHETTVNDVNAVKGLG